MELIFNSRAKSNETLKGKLWVMSKNRFNHPCFLAWVTVVVLNPIDQAE